MKRHSTEKWLTAQFSFQMQAANFLFGLFWTSSLSGNESNANKLKQKFYLINIKLGKRKVRAFPWDQFYAVIKLFRLLHQVQGIEILTICFILMVFGRILRGTVMISQIV